MLILVVPIDETITIYIHLHLRWQDGKLLSNVKGNKTKQMPKALNQVNLAELFQG